MWQPGQSLGRQRLHNVARTAQHLHPNLESLSNMPQQNDAFAQQALAHARRAAEWAGVRYSSETTASRCVRNDMPEKNETTSEAGAMCEVLVNGHFGYAATADTSAEGLQRAFETADGYIHQALLQQNQS